MLVLEGLLCAAWEEARPCVARLHVMHLPVCGSGASIAGHTPAALGALLALLGTGADVERHLHDAVVHTEYHF